MSQSNDSTSKKYCKDCAFCIFETVKKCSHIKTMEDTGDFQSCNIARLPWQACGEDAQLFAKRKQEEPKVFCRDCLFFEEKNSLYPSKCNRPELTDDIGRRRVCDSLRDYNGDCGPKGRYFKNKEEYEASKEKYQNRIDEKLCQDCIYCVLNKTHKGAYQIKYAHCSYNTDHMGKPRYMCSTERKWDCGESAVNFKPKVPFPEVRIIDEDKVLEKKKKWWEFFKR